MLTSFPKSIENSQSIITWVFVLILAYGVVSLPSSDWIGRAALIIGLLMVITGWQSFGAIAEASYNDILLITDLGLLATYWLLLYYGQRLSSSSTIYDATVYNLSGTVFLLYAIWDVVALVGRDTAAKATAAHLRRFAKTSFFFALVFFLLGIAAGQDFPFPDIIDSLRWIGLGVWIAILLWWQIGRFLAALSDNSVSPQQ
ncbi:MAG: hypothetical protein V5B30_12745 [Candidatus Accumulibacter delftensis]|jgi:hypothetical protein